MHEGNLCSACSRSWLLINHSYTFFFHFSNSLFNRFDAKCDMVNAFTAFHYKFGNCTFL